MEETKSLYPSNGTAWLLRPSVCWAVPSHIRVAGSRGFLWKFPLGQNVISVFCWSRSSLPTGSRHHQVEPVPVTSLSGAPICPCPWLQVMYCPWGGQVLAGSLLLPCPLAAGLTLHRLPLPPAPGLEPHRAHPEWFSNGTFVGKHESVTNVGIHLVRISWAGLSQQGFVASA